MSHRHESQHPNRSHIGIAACMDFPGAIERKCNEYKAKRLF